MGDVVLWVRIPPNRRSRSDLERSAIEGDSPVGICWKAVILCPRVPSPDFGLGSRETSTSKTKYVPRPIVYQYGDGKLKSAPEGGLKVLETRWL